MKAKPPNRDRRSGLRIGITGGVACGKSAVGRLLEAAGWDVLDADDVAHRCMRPGGPVFRNVVKRFGRDILADDGMIDRGKLGRRVFADESERRALNRLVHPVVLAECRQWRDARAAEGADAAVMLPLLFETGETDGWDAIVCVAANEEKAIERMARRGLNRDAARARWRAQMPLDEKIQRSDIVIENNGTLDELKERVWNALRKFCNHGEKEHGRE